MTKEEMRWYMSCKNAVDVLTENGYKAGYSSAGFCVYKDDETYEFILNEKFVFDRVVITNDELQEIFLTDIDCYTSYINSIVETLEKSSEYYKFYSEIRIMYSFGFLQNPNYDRKKEAFREKAIAARAKKEKEDAEKFATL